MIQPPADSHTTLDLAHDAILQALTNRFSAEIGNIGAYQFPPDGNGDWESRLLTPALLLRFEDMEVVDGQPDGWGRLELNCSLGIYCFLGFETPDLQRSLVALASEVAALVSPELQDDQVVRGNHWGLGGAAGPPERVTCQPAVLVPGLNGKDSWVVNWTQSFFLFNSGGSQ